jgi:hypothetical protein
MRPLLVTLLTALPLVAAAQPAPAAASNDLRVLAGHTLTVEAGAERTLMGTLVVEAGGALDLRGLLRFGPAAGLVVYGDMRADGGAMVALDPYAGWRGVRIERAAGTDPAPVAWTHTVVQAAAPTVEMGAGAAVVVVGRTLDMAGGGVELTRGGSGLYVASGSAHLSNGAAFDSNDGYGIVAGPGGHVAVVPQPNGDVVRVTGNGAGGVLAAGAGSVVALALAQVDGNFGAGIEAQAGGRVELSATARVVVQHNEVGIRSCGEGRVVALGCGEGVAPAACRVPALGHVVALNRTEGGACTPFVPIPALAP